MCRNKRSIYEYLTNVNSYDAKIFNLIDAMDAINIGTYGTLQIAKQEMLSTHPILTLTNEVSTGEFELSATNNLNTDFTMHFFVCLDSNNASSATASLVDFITFKLGDSSKVKYNITNTYVAGPPSIHTYGINVGNYSSTDTLVGTAINYTYGTPSTNASITDKTWFIMKIIYDRSNNILNTDFTYTTGSSPQVVQDGNISITLTQPITSIQLKGPATQILKVANFQLWNKKT
jgi:hypothetical protein